MWVFLHKLFVFAAQWRYLDKRTMVIYFLIIMSSWIVYKNECIISYYWKEKNYKNYKLGDNPDDVSDLGPFYKNNYLALFFYDFMKLIVTPYLFYKLTGSMKGMLIYQLVILLTLLNKEYSTKFLRTKFRYVLLIAITYLLTNQNFINDNYMNILVKIGLGLVFAVIIYTHYMYKNVIEDIDEMSYIGIAQIVYLLGKYIKN